MPRRTTGGISSACWRAARSPPHGGARAPHERARHQRDGQRHRAIAHAVEPRLLLSDFLRGTLGLTGTHVGCEHGVCGACTVLLDGDSVRACLMFAVQADGCRIETVESLGTHRQAQRRCRSRSASTTRCNAASARPAC